jgi:hypothetical protein
MMKSPLILPIAAFAALAIGACAGHSSAPDGGHGSGSGLGTSGESSGSAGLGGSTGDGSGGSASAIEGDATTRDEGSSGALADGGGVTRTPIPSDPNCPANVFTQATFVDLAPPMLAPLDRSHGDPLPDGGTGTVPSGWNFYQIDGAVCRDGSANGIYVRYTSSTKLVIYLEGGGACSSPHFCDHNPANIFQVFSGGSLNGESFAGSLLLQTGLQAPYTTGIFDTSNAANPFKDYNQVYVPYCTGDVHFGTNDNFMMADGILPTVMHQEHFVGYKNMQKFIGHLVPTFTNVDQVVLAGSSAGGFASGLNYGMVQDAFGSVPVTGLDDSGPPFTDVKYLPACLQKQWRDTFGFDGAFPSDCAECKASDGSGLTNVVLYYHHKYPNAKFGLVSSVHDQIIRLFFAAGSSNCQTNDPNLLSGLGLQGGDVPSYPGPLFAMGLDSIRAQFVCTGALSSYYIGTGDPDASDSNGSIDTLHQHIFRDRFYQPLAGAGQPTVAQWTADLVGGKPVSQVGP